MLSSIDPDSSMVEDPIAAALDSEISNLKSQISSLKSRRSLQASTILSSQRTLQTLNSLHAARAQQSSTSTSQPSQPQDTTPLLTTHHQQTTHNLTSLYRTLSTISTFHLHDPDPHAVDNGHILSLRFDICVSSGRFISPYYVFLNRPFGPDSDGGSEQRKGLYRVHRHTLPVGIPLSSIARRWLPSGKGVADGSSNRGIGQDLRGLVRAIRRELTSHHKRLSTIKTLRREFNLDSHSVSATSSKDKAKAPVSDKVITDISPADAEAKQVRIEWVDGRIGRVAVDDKGKIQKVVVIGEEGRDRVVEGRIMRRGMMEGIGEGLREGMY